MRYAKAEIEDRLSVPSDQAGETSPNGQKPFQVLQPSTNGLKLAKQMINGRLRGNSSELPIMNQLHSPLLKGSETWSSRKFDSLEERIDCFLKYMDLDPDNQSQLLVQFQEWYCNEKPIMPMTQLKRLFFGNQTQDGLVNYIKRCHENMQSIRTRHTLNFIKQLIDHSKCHQSHDFIELWQSLKPNDINECKFELFINARIQTKQREACFVLLQAYLGDKVFQIDNLLKHDLQAAHQYKLWVKTKNKH